MTRLAAALLALTINVLLFAALMTPRRGPAGPPSERPHAIMVLISDAPLITRPLAPRAALHMRPVRVTVPAPPGMLPVPVALGPPTETAASVAGEFAPERDATVIDARGLWEVCQRTYPGEFASADESVTLRVYVMADGRIGQGNVIRSTGDEHFGWMTLKCLQAHAHLEPARDDELPVGSWQRLTWNWSRP